MYCEYLGLDLIGGWGAKSLALAVKSLALEAKSLALALEVKALALALTPLALALEFVALTPSLKIWYLMCSYTVIDHDSLNIIGVSEGLLHAYSYLTNLIVAVLC